MKQNTLSRSNKWLFKTIGILGGMGAAASADFYGRIVKIAQKDYKAERDPDFPPMFIYNLPLSGFDETGFVNPERVKAQLIAGVKKLETAGSQFIVIPCNTVHRFHSEMETAIEIPIISIIETTTDAIRHSGYHTVGLLNSQSTKQYSLYEKSLSKKKISSLSTTQEEQKKINQIISHVMAGTQGKTDTQVLRNIIQRYIREGAQAVILGCTELPLAISQKDTNIPLFNSTDLLAKATLRHAYQSQK